MMVGRSLITAAGIVGACLAAGYGTAYLLGGPAPAVITALRFYFHASIDEVQLRAALEGSQKVLAHTASTVQRGGTVAAGNALAEAIRFSRQQALKSHDRPLSDDIKELYRPYFPDELIDDTRWTLAGRRIGLGSVLAGWYYREGAVTLDNVIVFSNWKAAHHEALVAHELTHVMQYRQLGVSKFARLYVQNWPLLEEQARRNAGRVVADIRANRVG